jgi:hypothetical protein
MTPQLALPCARCGLRLPPNPAEWRSISQCPRCHAPIQITVFPNLGRPAASGRSAELIVEAGESPCFYHADKRAVVHCHECGRFLCALCDIQLGEAHVCPACLSRAKKQASGSPMERKRTRYDQIVQGLVLLPVPFCFLIAPVTGLAAIALAIWKWRAPPSLLVNTRTRLIAGIILAVLEVIAGCIIWSLSILRQQ